MNTQEISDAELLLYHYRDGLETAQRERIASALMAQPELACRLQTLVAQLDAAALIPELPVPPATLRRWHAALEHRATTTRAAPARLAGSTQRWRQPALAALAAATLVIAFRLGMYMAAERTAPLIAANEASQCECGLKWHLASVEQQLGKVSATQGAQRSALIDAVVAQNRVYAIAAERGGDSRLAGALRSFTLILERLAKDDARNGLLAADVAQLNFELRVMQARLSAEAGSSAAPAVAL
jgi:anti-sigma-K factor RskA